jgi:RNA polymerase sigma factor (sigma-70 family)
MKDVSQLVEAAQAGDSEAYTALIQHFQGMAYAIASRYVGDYHLAQDLVQEAIIEAFVHLPQLKEPSAFPGWFRQIVFRQCTRLLRQAPFPSSSLEAASANLFVEKDTEDLVMQAERSAFVRSALASLPRHEQEIVALFYGCGYSYKEVSALLKIPLTTVKKRLHSARQKIKMQLLSEEIEHAYERSKIHGAGCAIRYRGPECSRSRSDRPGVCRRSWHGRSHLGTVSPGRACATSMRWLSGSSRYRRVF